MRKSPQMSPQETATVIQGYEGAGVRTPDLGIKSPLLLSAPISTGGESGRIRAGFGGGDRTDPHGTAGDSPQKSPQALRPLLCPLHPHSTGFLAALGLSLQVSR